MSIHATLLTSLAERPPPEFFAAQVDVPATLAANAAALEGGPIYAQLMQQWKLASEPHVTPDGRLALGVIAQFLEGPKESRKALSGAQQDSLLSHNSGGFQ